MAAYASSNSATGTSGTVTITKPSGLAAGDLMVAIVSDDTRSGGFNTPSGWTAITSADNGSPFEMTIAVFAKIASAGDASATDFSFTHTSGSAVLGGVLYRITGTLAATNNIYRTAANTGTEPSADVFRFATGFTPDTASTLLIMAVYGHSDNNGFDDSNASAYALETNNPTWTERHDFVYATSMRLSTATATRTETTATGYYQVTYTVVGAETPVQAVGVLLGITDTANGTATPSAIAITGTVPTPSSSGAANVTVTAVSMSSTVPTPTAAGGTNDALWKNTDKPSPGSISNTDKP